MHFFFAVLARTPLKKEGNCKERTRTKSEREVKKRARRERKGNKARGAKKERKIHNFAAAAAWQTQGTLEREREGALLYPARAAAAAAAARLAVY